MAVSDELENALKALLEGGAARDLENEILDFKRAANEDGETFRIAVDAAICFANHLGGEVVIGIDERRVGAEAVLGTSIDVRTLRRRIHELTRPPLPVDVLELELLDRRLVVVKVYETSEVYADTKGRASQRNDTDCVSLDPAAVARLRDEKFGIDWSSDVCEWAHRRDARAEALGLARTRLARYEDARRALSRSSDRDLLAGLGLIDARGRLLNAGAVLLCPPPPAISTAWINFISRRTPGSEPVVSRQVEGSMLEAFEEAERLMDARRQTTPILVPGGQQLELEDFPELAVREALANAILHRDYHLRGPVLVDHSPQVFVVTSPGPLVHSVTARNILRHPPQPRNAALATAGHKLGLAEEVGAGVDRMYRAMLSTGKEIPVIESDSESVRVSLVGGAPDTQVGRFVATLPDEEQKDVDTMIVLHHVRANPKVRAADLTDLLQRPEPEVQAVLERLASDHVDLLEPTRDTARLRRPRYRLRDAPLRALGTAVGYQRRTVDEIDRKVIEIVASYGSIRNEVVKTLFNVRVERASAILRDLVNRGVLVRTSEATRGPGVEYGPGPRFPRTVRRKRVRASADDG